MATKPADTPRWASDVSALIVEPVAGKKDVGSLAGERLAAQHDNWLRHKAYEWLEYLKDGDFQGAHTFDDDVVIAGNLEVAGVIARSDRRRMISIMSGYPANSDSGGDFFDRSESLSIPNGVADAGASAGDGMDWVIPLQFEEGERIKSALLYCNGVGTAGGKRIEFQIRRIGKGGGTSAVVATGVPNSGASPDQNDIDLTGAPHVVATDYFYFAYCLLVGGWSAAQVAQLFGLVLTTDVIV